MFTQYQKLLILFIVVSILLLTSESSADAPKVELVANPDKTEIFTDSEPIALLAEASGSNLKFQWELQGVGEFEGSKTSPAIFYVPPEKIGGESARVIVSVKVSNDKGEETTKSKVFKIINPVTPQPTERPHPTPTPPVDITTDQTLYDIETCEGKVKVDRNDSAYPFRKHPWLIESLKTCESERWWIIAWEIIGSERFCRYQIFISGEEEAKSKLKNGDLFAQKEIVFTPQDTNWYPEGQRDRCSQNRGDKAWTISLTPARNR